MPVQVNPINSDLAYAYCTVCRANGNPDSMLKRDTTGRIQCQFGHSPQLLQQDHATRGLVPMDADTIKLSDIQPEIPLPTDVRWQVWVHPKLKELIESKFKGRVFTTIQTLLWAMVDGSLLIISGEEGKELRRRGIRSGAEMIAALKASEEREKNFQSAMEQIEKFQEVLNAAGMLK